MPASNRFLQRGALHEGIPKRSLGTRRNGVWEREKTDNFHDKSVKNQSFFSGLITSMSRLMYRRKTLLPRFR